MVNPIHSSLNTFPYVNVSPILVKVSEPLNARRCYKNIRSSYQLCSLMNNCLTSSPSRFKNPSYRGKSFYSWNVSCGGTGK